MGVLFNEVDVPIANAGTTPIVMPGAALTLPEPRLLELQAWPRNIALNGKQSVLVGTWEAFWLCWQLDDAIQTVPIPVLGGTWACGPNVMLGPRGWRFQCIARSAQLMLICGQNTNTSQLRIATRVTEASVAVPKLPSLLQVREGGFPAQFPKFATEYRVVGGLGRWHTLVDSNGTALDPAEGDVTVNYARIANDNTQEWTPIHPHAAGITGTANADSLDLKVEAR